MMYHCQVLIISKAYLKNLMKDLSICLYAKIDKFYVNLLIYFDKQNIVIYKRKKINANYLNIKYNYIVDCLYFILYCKYNLQTNKVSFSTTLALNLEQIIATVINNRFFFMIYVDYDKNRERKFV